MAVSAPRNPRVCRLANGEYPERTTVPAAVSQTWRANAPFKFTSGLATLTATDDTNIDGLFADNQTTSTTASESVDAYMLTENMELDIYVSSDASDAAAATAHRGEDFGVQVGSNGTFSVATCNVNETSNVIFHVEDLIWRDETLENAASDSPGRVRVSIVGGGTRN